MTTKIKLIAFLLLLPLYVLAQNTSVWLYNNPINGYEQSDDGFGVGDFSEDGSIIAGSLAYFSGANAEFRLKVYQRDGSGSWNQLGQSIEEHNGYFSYGYTSVDLNASGNTVVYSFSKGNTITNDYMTRPVKAFRYNGSSWVQLGQTIQNTPDSFFFGAKLNSDGNKMAVAVRNISNPTAGFDYVRIYEFNGTQWVQSGQDIPLPNAGYRVGHLSFSLDGNMVTFSGTSSVQSYVISYRYNGTTWAQKGQILYLNQMESDPYKTFYSVRMSGDASTIAVHTSIYQADAPGAIYVYGWDASSDSWIQKSVPIIVKGQSEVSISTNGKRIATGNPDAYDEQNGQDGDSNGEARVFDYDPSSSSYVQVFFTQPWLKWSFVGTSAGISGNGKRLAYGQGYDGGMWWISVYDYIEPTGVSMSTAGGADQYIHTGETVQLQAAVLPEDFENQQVQWSVASGSGFVSVNTNGLVTGITNGTATIKATSVANPDVYGSIRITVLDGTPPEEHNCSQEFNGDIVDGVASLRQGGYWAANDFDVPEGSVFTLKNISVPVISLGGVPVDYSVKIYKDSGSGPGEEIKSFPDMTAVTQSIIKDMNYQYLVYSSTVDLGEGIELEGGKKYWVALGASPTTQDKPLYWGMSETSTTEPTYQSTDGGNSWAITSSGSTYDGVFTISGECRENLAVSESGVKEFIYYPNPVKDILNIRTDKTIKNVSVYNPAGQKVKDNLKTVNGQLNLSSLTAGNYIISVTLADGEMKTFKIIKN